MTGLRIIQMNAWKVLRATPGHRALSQRLSVNIIPNVHVITRPALKYLTTFPPLDNTVIFFKPHLFIVQYNWIYYTDPG